MSYLGIPSGGRGKPSMKIYSMIVLIALFVHIFTIIVLWTTFLPRMEKAARETEELVEEIGSGEEASVIQEEAIQDIRMVYLLYLISFCVLDTIFALMLWKSNIPNEKDKTAGTFIEGYVQLRAFGLFLIVMMSIMAMVGSNPGFILNLLFLLVPAFLSICMIYIIIFHKKFLEVKLEDELRFQITEESS